MTHNDNSEQMITYFFTFVALPSSCASFFVLSIDACFCKMKNVCTSFESKINLHIVRSSRINERIKLTVCLYLYERYFSVGNFSLTVQQFTEGRDSEEKETVSQQMREIAIAI